jgi:hypothetical protein
MSLTNEILATADSALMAAQESEGSARLQAMTDFMHSFEQLAYAVANDEATWAEARPWAERTAEQLCSARDALTAWELELGEHFYSGGEERAERALVWRSQHAIARELFRDTAAYELLVAYEDNEVDHDLRDRAERLALDRPSWAPQTHTWWRNQ